MQHRPRRESFFIRVWVFATNERPHFVDRASVVFAEKGTRLLPTLTRAVFRVGFEIPLDELLRGYAQMARDSSNVVRRKCDVHGLTTVCAASALHNLKRPIVEFGRQRIGPKAVTPELHAPKKLVVLLIMRLGVVLPILYN
jgi:hypothetical protein